MTGPGIAVAFLLLLWCALLFVPFIAALGLALAAVGGVFGSWWIAVPAGAAAIGALVVIARVGFARTDLAGALGAGWQDRIPAERRKGMVRRWWTGRLRSGPQPRLRRDVRFATVPGTGRVLACDVWQPPPGVRPQSSLGWADVQDGAAVVNTTLERQKARNMAANPKVSLLVVDPGNTSRYIQTRGDAELTTEGAPGHLDAITRIYTSYPAFYGYVYPAGSVRGKPGSSAASAPGGSPSTRSISPTTDLRPSRPR